MYGRGKVGYSSGQRGQTVNLLAYAFQGSNPCPTTIFVAGVVTMVAESDFIDFAARVLGVPAAGLSLDSAYASIPEWDSVMHLRLVMEFEAKYGVPIPLEAVAELKTLGDFHGRIPC